MFNELKYITIYTVIIHLGSIEKPGSVCPAYRFVPLTSDPSQNMQ